MMPLISTGVNGQTAGFLPLAPLSFTMQVGGNNPLPQTLTIASTGGQFAFHPSDPMTASGGSWLGLSGCSSNCYEPAVYSLSVSAAGLPAGTYTGQIVFTSNDLSRSITVVVTLTVTGTGSPSLGGAPGSLSFVAGSGLTSAAQNVQIANDGGGTLSWTAAASMFNGPAVGTSNWLTFAASGGTAPAILTVSVSASGLAPGLYLGQVLLQTGNSSTTIPVTLEVTGANNIVFQQPPALNFTMQAGSNNPLPQTLTITSAGGQFAFYPSNPVTASGGNWLGWSGCGSNCYQPAVYDVSINAAGLPAGTYTGQIVFTSNDLSRSITVLVTLTVTGTGSPALGGVPGNLSFVAGSGLTPAPQTLQITNTGGGTLSWTAAVSTFNGPTVGSSNWLTFAASGGTAPAILTVSVSATGLAPGLYLGQILLQTGNYGATIPVTLEVAGTGTAVFQQPPALNFTMQAGSNTPLPQTLTITSAGGQFAFYPSNPVTASGGNWLGWSGCSSNCYQPAVYDVSVNAAGLPAGTYTGQIVFTSNDLSRSITVLVTLTVTGPGSPSLGGVPGSLSFVASNGVTPATQTVQIANAGGGTLNWTAAVSMFNGPTVGTSNWLTFAASGGTAPAILTVSVSATGLAPGLYLGQVLLQTGNSSTTIPVTLEVAGTGNVVFQQPSALSFTMQEGGGNPLSQTLTIASTGGQFAFYPSNPVTSSGGNWLGLSGCSSNCYQPAVYNVSVNAAGLPAGIYTGQIVFTSNDLARSITVLVTLTVVSAQPVPTLSSISPTSGTAGSIVTTVLTGTGFVSGAAVQVTNSGIVISNVTVVSATQISATFAISPSATGSGNVTVTTSGGTSGSVSFGVNPAGTGGVLVATPTALSFVYQLGANAPPSQSLTISSTNSTHLSFAVSTATTDGANWLQPGVSGGTTPTPFNVIVSPVNLKAGSYSGTLTISSANVPSVTVSVSLAVIAAVPPQLNVQAPPLNFSGVQGGSATTGQIQVSNTGGGVLNFTASAQGGTWLTVSPSTGVIDNSSAASGSAPPVSLTVTCDPSSLAPGVYLGSIVVAGAGSSVTAPVAFSVAASSRAILVSQSAISFTAVAQAGSPLPKQLGILNIGSGTLNWTAALMPLSGGNWLVMSPTSGSVVRPYLDVSLASLSIDPSVLAGLQPGDYYTQIQITAAAVNSPQSVTVHLSVLAAGSNPGPELNPSSLIFTGTAGTSPSAQNVSVGITRSSSDQYVSGNIGKGFSYAPASATVPPSNPVSMAVTPDFSSLQPGEIDRGTITLQFSDGTPRTVSVLTVVAPSSSGNAKVSPRASTGCSNLNLQWRNPQPPSFTVVQGQGQVLELQIVDNCGNLIGPGNPQGASVLATFSDGDSNVSLIHVGNGVWTGTWTPVMASSSAVTVSVTASSSLGAVAQTGQASSLSATVLPGMSPIVANGGIVQSASLLPTPIAPGTLISIFGSNLADPQGQNPTQVMLGNLQLPLLYTGTGQVNAQVPYNVTLNTAAQLTVQRGNALSAPQQLVVASAQPGIFTMDESGTGAGAIFNSVGKPVAQNPAAVGDIIVIYCTGLGAVSPPIAAGVPPPVSPLSQTVGTVTVTINGVNVSQVLYSGLTPGSPGVYQLNVVVPVGADAGNAANVPVTMTINGYESRPVLIPRPRPSGSTPGDRPSKPVAQ
jgi:uncharacterized protein (TIGR03437 family)